MGRQLLPPLTREPNLALPAPCPPPAHPAPGEPRDFTLGPGPASPPTRPHSLAHLSTLKGCLISPPLQIWKRRPREVNWLVAGPKHPFVEYLS